MSLSQVEKAIKEGIPRIQRAYPQYPTTSGRGWEWWDDVLNDDDDTISVMGGFVQVRPGVWFPVDDPGIDQELAKDTPAAPAGTAQAAEKFVTLKPEDLRRCWLIDENTTRSYDVVGIVDRGEATIIRLEEYTTGKTKEVSFSVIRSWLMDGTWTIHYFPVDQYL